MNDDLKPDENETNLLEIDENLLKILVCPLTKSPLTYDKAANELISEKARLAFPIRGGIPIMLPSEARDLDKTT